MKMIAFAGQSFTITFASTSATWTPAQIDQIADDAFYLLKAGGRNLLAAFSNAGGRFTLLNTPDDQGWAWYNPTTGDVQFGVSFFGPARNFRVGTLPSQGVIALAHEIAHAFDYTRPGGRLSAGSFLDLFGFRRDGNKWKVNGVDSERFHTDYRKMAALSQKVETFQLAFEMNHFSGMQYGFPTLYSMTNPTESFAEIVAYVLVDPEVSRYLSSDKIRWIRENVLD